MRSYKFHKEDERPTEDKKSENERLMKELLFGIHQRQAHPRLGDVEKL